jgi:DNA end-binding protein Ku
MPARSIGSGSISFGLVSIPVRFYVATHSEQPHFNQLHAACGTRIRQQLFCPHCERVVDRTELAKGYEVAHGQYVTFGEEELKALEAEASPTIDIHEFVPLAKVDPVYFEDSHYLGPDKGAEKAYHLLAGAMTDTGRVALAQHTTRGKEHLVLIRPMDGGLVLHTLYYADEVRSLDDVVKGTATKARPAEIDLARKLIEQLAAETFRPEQYRDHWRDRVAEVVEKKIAGEEVTAAAPTAPRAQVIDLMDALKQSIARERGREGKTDAAPARQRPPAAEARAAADRGRRRAAKK